MMRSGQTRKVGFTLFEMLLVLSVVIVFVSVSIVGTQTFYRRQVTMRILYRLRDALYFARWMAIKNVATVVVCGSVDHRTCDGRWTSGWIIQQGGRVLRVFPALASGYHLIWRSSLGRDQRIIWTARGVPSGQNGRFILSFQDASSEVGALVLARSGRIRLAQ